MTHIQINESVFYEVNTREQYFAGLYEHSCWLYYSVCVLFLSDLNGSPLLLCVKAVLMLDKVSM